MRLAVVFTAVALLVACRGQRVPRDYQNNPPAMTHPVTSSSDAPSQRGMPGAAPEPNYGVEGKNPQQPKTKIGNQAPVTDTQHATQTTATAATGTALSTRP